MINIKNISTGIVNKIKQELGILDPKIEELAVPRYFICSSCPNNKKGRCKLCDCLLKLKTLVPEEQCPDNPRRW